MSEVRRVTDDDGDAIRVSQADGQVYLAIGDRAVRLSPAQQEEFAQVYVAKCREAEASAGAARAEAREEARAHAEAVREERLEAAEIAADRRAYFDID